MLLLHVLGPDYRSKETRTLGTRLISLSPYLPPLVGAEELRGDEVEAVAGVGEGDGHLRVCVWGSGGWDVSFKWTGC